MKMISSLVSINKHICPHSHSSPASRPPAGSLLTVLSYFYGLQTLSSMNGNRLILQVWRHIGYQIIYKTQPAHKPTHCTKLKQSTQITAHDPEWNWAKTAGQRFTRSLWSSRKDLVTTCSFSREGLEYFSKLISEPHSAHSPTAELSRGTKLWSIWSCTSQQEPQSPHTGCSL